MGGGVSSRAESGAAELESLRSLVQSAAASHQSELRKLASAHEVQAKEVERQRRELETARRTLEVHTRAAKDKAADLEQIIQRLQRTGSKDDTADVEQIRQSVVATSNPLELRGAPEEEAGATTAGATTAGAHGKAAAGAAAALTYAEAFAAVGGEAALGEASELSQALMRRVNDEELAEAVAGMLPRDYRQRLGYSTVPLNQDYQATLEGLYVRAARVLPLFTRRVQELAKDTGAEALIPPLKGASRAEMKSLFKYRDSGGGVAYYRLTDIVRATLVYDDIPSMYAGLAAVVDAFGQDCRELNDRYQHPLAGGYRDLQAVVWFEGHFCELQISTEPMLRAKKTTGHRDYELVRELVAAVAESNLKRVRLAFEWGQSNLGSMAGVSTVLRADGATLIHAAARRGDAEIVKCFLENGADCNSLDGDGNTPLHLAVAGGHERTIWVLLNYGGASTSVENAAGRTALLEGFLMLRRQPDESATRGVMTLSYATGAAEVRKMKAKASEELKKLYHNSRPLVDAAADGNLEKAREELRAFADPDSLDANGHCALAVALVAGHAEMAELLEGWLAQMPDRLRADQGLSVRDVLARGFPTSALRSAGYSARELLDGGIALCELQRGDFGKDAKLLCTQWSQPAELIGRTVQLVCSYWNEKGEDARMYAAGPTSRGPDNSTRPVLMSKAKGDLTSTKGDWVVEKVKGKPGQLSFKSSYWAEKGEDARMYAASYDGPNSKTRLVLMSKPLGHLTSTKADWIVEEVQGKPGQVQLKSSHWVEKGEDARIYAADYDGPNKKTRCVLMSKPKGHLTSTKGNWIVKIVG